MSRTDTSDARSPSPGYYRVATADGVEFRLDPRAVRFARRFMGVYAPAMLLTVLCPFPFFVALVGHLLAGWWGTLPGVGAMIALAVTISRWAARWADREGNKVLVVEPDGRIALGGETLVRRGRATGVRVERAEWQDEGPNVHFRVVVDTADGPVPLPVPENGMWSVRSHYKYDWLLGFDAKEDAERFAGEIADALRPSRG